MKMFITLLFLTFTLFASENYATKEDIKELKSDIRLILTKLDNMNQKLNEIDKRVQVNSVKIEMLEKNMNKRFEDINKRFEDTNKRFEDINKRFEDINKRFDFISKIITALVAGIFGLVGFMMWDRRTVLEKAREECDIKADREYVEKIAQAIKEILNKDEYAKEIFRKYGLL